MDVPLSWSIDTLALNPSPAKASSSPTAGVVERCITGSGSNAAQLPSGARIVRRWEGARTDRLNEAHWADAHGMPIDQDLAFDLPTLRARVSYEFHNNPIVEGVVSTHAVDVVGSEGPSLEVQCDDDRYAEQLESRWEEWSELCDHTGEMSLVEMTQLWIRQLWTAGSILVQETTDESGSSFPATLRLQALHANRLETPWGMQGNARIAFGIRRTDSGRPLSYYISQPKFFGEHQIMTGRYTEVAAKWIYHGFVRSEPGQSVGYPLLASALPAIGDLRDYDRSVLDAARLAADRSEWFVNLDPTGDKFEPDDGKSFEVGYKRMTTRAAPPGWDVRAHDAKHPTANYVEHRKERMSELGRSAAMPLMLIRLDSSQHNYSSARFDHQAYIRHLENWQAWLGRIALTRAAKRVARELHYSGDLRAPRGPVKFYWSFQPPPKGDPVKERAAERMGLQNRTLTFADACRLQNLKESEVIESWARTRKLLLQAGFTPQEVMIFLAMTGPGRGGTPNDARPGNDPSNRPQTAAAPS